MRLAKGRFGLSKLTEPVEAQAPLRDVFRRVLRAELGREAAAVEFFGQRFGVGESLLVEKESGQRAQRAERVGVILARDLAATLQRLAQERLRVSGLVLLVQDVP